ncbi:hypothetical protein KAU45_11395 [bacterium]|nr:hypothetical protein [bacterium]
MSQDWETILSIGIPSLFVIVNIIATIRLSYKSRIFSRQLEEYKIKSERSENERQELLSNFLETIQKSAKSDTKQDEINTLMKKAIYLFPDNVVKCLLAFKTINPVKIVKEDPNALVVLLGVILLEIRKALGFSETKIKVKDILNFIINDKRYTDKEVENAEKVLTKHSSFLSDIV